MFCQVQPAAKQRKPVISVDYESMVAIKTSEGLEEKKKLESGPGGVCHCTWDDGTVYASDVPALFLTMPRAPILAMKVSKKKKEKKVSLKRPSAAEALAAKRIKAAADEEDEAVTQLKENIARQDKKNSIKFDLIEKNLDL